MESDATIPAKRRRTHRSSKKDRKTPERLASNAIPLCATANIPKAVPFVGTPRDWTLSVALPVSCVANAQSHVLRSYLVGQLGRAMAIFGVDEVIVFDDLGTDEDRTQSERWSEFFVMNLEYLETPQYLRRSLFTMREDLKFAGLENPLDAPHHLRSNELLPYREGAVKSSCTETKTSQIEIGFGDPIKVNGILPRKTRVTVRLPSTFRLPAHKTRGPPEPQESPATVVTPLEPVRRLGLYWGYRVRPASSLRQVLESTSFANVSEYDLVVGTSDKGQPSDNVDGLRDSPFKHALIVFGGISGLEDAAQRERLEGASQESRGRAAGPAKLFDWYLNTCPDQTSRVIRTEEAVLISMAKLRPMLLACQD